MARNQLYLYTIVVVILIYSLYIFHLTQINQNVYEFYYHYQNTGSILYVEKMANIFDNILLIKNSTLIRFSVIYNCSDNIISIPNYFNSPNVQVLDEEFNLLPTYADNFFVNFSVSNPEYIGNLCYFSGYLLYNSSISMNATNPGSFPFSYLYDINSYINIRNISLSNLINSLTFSSQYYKIAYTEGCPTIYISLPTASTIYYSKDISLLNISLINYNLSSATTTVQIANIGKCPVILNDILYRDSNYGFYYPINTNYILEPSQQTYLTLPYDAGNALYFYTANREISIEVPISIPEIEIIVQNNQSIPTLAPFQLLLNISSSMINNSTLWNEIINYPLNITFFTPDGKAYAWIENITSNNILVWLNLPDGIPPASDFPIYMFILNQNQYPYTGINPIIASNYGYTWGQYDNGQYVFYFYANGTSLSVFNAFNCWCGSPFYGSYSVTSSAPSPYPYAFNISVSGAIWRANTWTTLANTSLNLNFPFIAQGLVYINGSSPFTDMLTNIQSLPWGPYYLFRFTAVSGSYDLIGYYSPQSASTIVLNQSSITSSTGTWYQMTVINNNGYLYLYKSTTFGLSNYGTLEVTNNTQGTSYYLNGDGFGITTDGSTGTYYWTMLIVRAYPPNGVMPQIVNVTVIYPS